MKNVEEYFKGLADINRLRIKVEADPGNPSRILTVWGHGYRFAAAP